MQFDHLVHWVPSLDAAVRDYRALGFTVQPGGQHRGSGTYNAVWRLDTRYIELIAVSVGNPHAVVAGDPSRIEELGPRLEVHPRFPERTNVQVARVERPGEVTARVWERGVGETAASGTSAVAVAAATHGDGEVVVHFPGGDLRVRLAGGRAWLTGPAEPLV